jgi:hypothetical protein
MSASPVSKSLGIVNLAGLYGRGEGDKKGRRQHTPVAPACDIDRLEF